MTGTLWRRAGWLALLAAVAGCAGYQIGAQSLYPCHIQTVYVPIFESTSFRRNLGERLTEAVIKEIELKTPYKVTGTPDADSVLSGRILSDTKRVITPTPTGDPRQIETGLRVLVKWTDRSGNTLRNGESVPLDEATVATTSTGKVVPEVGQSIATGQQTAIQRAAEQIVSLMEAPW
jgi:6-phosphofructokinase